MAFSPRCFTRLTKRAKRLGLKGLVILGGIPNRLAPAILDVYCVTAGSAYGVATAAPKFSEPLAVVKISELPLIV